MSKKWTKVPKGKWDEVNAKRRAQRDRRKFLDTLKHGGRKVSDYAEMTHDGSDFTIKATGTGDFDVYQGSTGVSGSTYRKLQEAKHHLSNTKAS